MTRTKIAKTINNPFLLFPNNKEEVRKTAVIKIVINIPIIKTDDGGILKKINTAKTQSATVKTNPGR